jgi:hypothetical protein
MAASDNLSRQQFTGMMPLSSLRPREKTAENENWARRGAAWDNQQSMVNHIAEHGFESVGPIEVSYHAGGPLGLGRGTTPRAYIAQGHHRYHAAKQLGLTHVPVVVDSRIGRPPEMLDEE